MNTKMRTALKSLIAGNTVTQAARDAGVTERTIYNWLQNEEFNAELRKYEGMILDRIAGGLLVDAQAARKEISRQLLAGTTVEKRHAARLILSHVLKFREQTDLLQRIERLEDKFNAQSS